MGRCTLLLVLALLLAPGCGGEEPPPPKPVVMPLPEIEEVPFTERVRYALERLERGPAPVGALRVPEIHRRNLELAEDDLLALERQAQELLAQPEVIARITKMARRNADPWHNVLRVLLGMEPQNRPVKLVLAWTEPVLQAPRETVTLRLEAVRLLATMQDARVGPVLLELFRQAPGDRELAMIAFFALMRHPEVRSEALAIALRQGTPRLWVDAWQRIAQLVPAGEMDPALADVLTWWCALTAGSGPRMPTSLPHLKTHPWAQARLGTDEAVPRRADGAPSRQLYGPISSSIAHGIGWFATDLSQEALYPQYASMFTGKLPAAGGRCMLGRWGFEGYVAAVEADLQLEGVDNGLYYNAKHCMLQPMEEDDEVTWTQLALELDRSTPWTRPAVTRVQQLLGSLSSCDEDKSWNLLQRAMLEMHPLDVCRPAIEQAYDAMRPRPQDLVPLVKAALKDADERKRGVALHLVRRARDPAYIEALEALLDGSPDAASVGPLRRTLTFIYSRGYDIHPDRYATFVKRYEGWLADADDREAAGLATGLLDFGEPGIAAFEKGLRGPRRDVYLAAWPRDRRIVPLPVAAAAIEPMDADTPAPVVAAMLGRAYHSFPAQSVAVLEALRRRLLPDVRPLVEPVLERVRHRAPFRRRVQ